MKEDWLASHPPQIQALAARHDFHPTETIIDGYCAVVYFDPTRALKIPFQGEELTSGLPAAHALQAAGGPKILASDPTTGTILMERLLPGTRLSARPDLDDIQIFAQLTKKIHTLPPPPGLLPLENYYENPVPLTQKLLATAPPPVFLHGDLHHENILLHGDQWRPIDPKGLLGDPHFEAAAFLRNPLCLIPNLPLPELETLHTKRIKTLAQTLNLDPQRLAAWAYADRLQDIQEDPTSPWANVLPAYQNVYQMFGD